MAFCANCGANVGQEQGFCGGCGKPTGAVSVPPVSQAGGPGQAGANAGIPANIAGALAYSFGLITGVLFLVLEPYRGMRFVRFHAMQSILLNIACIVLMIAWRIVWGILFRITSVFLFLDVSLSLLISLGLFLLWLYLMYQAYSQREYHVPFLGDLAEKQLGA